MTEVKVLDDQVKLERPLSQLRWLRADVRFTRLQQAYRVETFDRQHERISATIEWRDVPVVEEDRA